MADTKTCEHDWRRGPGPTDFTFTVETVCVKCWITGRVPWPSDIPAWTDADYQQHREQVEALRGDWLRQQTQLAYDMAGYARPITFTTDENGNPVPQWPSSS